MTQRQIQQLQAQQHYAPAPTPTPIPAAIMQRPHAPPSFLAPSIYPSDDGSGGVEETKHGEARPAAATKLEVEELKGLVTDLTKRVSALKESSTRFFGLVSGGAGGHVMLFSTIPKEMRPERAAARAEKGTWVRLSHPQTRVERKMPGGSVQIDTWLRAYAMDARTSDVNVYWVRDKAEDESPAFSTYEWYPREA
jgi:hypothetical protein